jgi:RNA polymerase sigma-70 factor (ECF subfamily)
MQESDLDIVKLRQGEASAYVQLLHKYQSKVFATCYKFFLNEEDAKDLTQEVFMEVFESIKHFKEEAQLSTWIFRITSNKCLDEIKRRNRKKRLSNIANKIGLDSIQNLLISHQNPERDLLIKEELRIVLIAMNKLTDQQRTAYTLSKVESYSTKEIAEILSISISATEGLIKRAKQKLLEELKKDQK